MENKEKINKPLDIIHYYLKENGNFPNNPHLPLLIYHQVFTLPDSDPALVEEQLNDNNWKNSWRNGILDYHHFHSNSHEVIAVYSGKALVMFGGPKGPEEVLKKGDVAILPAGTAHKAIQLDEDFACIGAYPAGRSYDMHSGDEQEFSEVKRNIQKVVIPVNDPVFGKEGPLFDYWKTQ